MKTDKARIRQLEHCLQAVLDMAAERLEYIERFGNDGDDTDAETLTAIVNRIGRTYRPKPMESKETKEGK